MKRKRMTFLICCVSAVVAVLMGVMVGISHHTRASAAIETVTAVPLYRLVHQKLGFHYYTADAHEREVAIKYHQYRDENIAAYVLPKRAHGTVALYRLSAPALACKGTWDTAKFYYTTDEAWRDKSVAAGWHLDGVVGYVAPPDRGLPGTIPFHVMYHDTSECKKVSSIQVANLPDRPRATRNPGDDNHFYTTSEAEKDQAIYQGGYKSRGVAAYVWPTPVAVAMSAPAAPLPDLTVRQVEAEEFSVKAVVVNEGQANTGGAQLYAHLVLYDKAGKNIFSNGKFVGGMSPGQARPVKFETEGHSLVGLQYEIKVDLSNLIKESNESNNVTQRAAFHRTIKINPDPNAASRVPAPSIAITGVETTATQAQPKRTSYRLTVSNWASYDAAWFQSLKNKLPPAPCGSGATDARMLMRYSLIRNGAPVNVGCKPLNSPQDLKVGEIHSAQPLADTDRLVVTLEDRADGAKYPSAAFAVGWFGLGDVLTTVGCKYFLGRAGSYLCTTDKGMAACENLKLKGKPIQCTRAGTKAN